MTGDETPGFLARDTVALLTPIANGDVLAAICALGGCKCDVLEVPGGTLAVLVDQDEEATGRAARAVATVAGGAIVLAMERRGGQLTVVRWQGTEPGEELPPGLALDRAPEAVTSLMTGAVTVEDLFARDPSLVHSGRVGRFRALWRLRRLARQGRREHRAAGA